MAPPPPAPGIEWQIGRQAEEEWSRLRRQLDLAEGFWLGLVFTDSSAIAEVFRHRTETVLRQHARTLAVRRPRTPAELIASLDWLLPAADESRGGLWLEAVGGGPADREARAWRRAWERFFLRLNERREPLRRCACAMVLVARPELKPLFRDSAPDLWSIRGIVVEPRAASAEPAGGPPSPTPRPEPTIAATDDLADESDVAPPPETLRALRKAAGLLASQRPEEARDLALEALDQLRTAATSSAVIAPALALLGRIEHALGDPNAADRFRAAIDLRRGHSDATLLEWLVLEAEVVEERLGDLGRATEILEEALNLARKLTSLSGRRDLTFLGSTLDRLGKILTARGATRKAVAVHQDAVDLAREVLDKLGSSPARLSNLAVSLGELARVLRLQGELNRATAAQEEALRISRRILEIYGESHENLRLLFANLHGIGHLQKVQGELDSSVLSHEEALQTTRLANELYGESEESLRDLSIGLNDVGDARADREELDLAWAAFEEALQIRRRICQQYGDSPQSLRDLAVSLSRCGSILRLHGQRVRSRAALDEAAEITRRLLDHYGTTPTTDSLQADIKAELDQLAATGDVE